METLKEYLKYEIDRGRNFAFTIDGNESLLHLLKNEKGLKKTREAAQREAGENYRVEEASNESSIEELIADGKVVIWDLKEELQELE